MSDSLLREVARIWSWLPAFRAVAETLHLPTAAQNLHVSAPALSRSIRLLEEALGKPLFRRHGRRLELNGEGRLLLSGQRDLALASKVPEDPRLQRIELGTASSGLYCGRGHPLFGCTELRPADLEGHEFTAPPPTEVERNTDGWPSEWPRRVGIAVDQMALGVELCRSGSHLAVLPDPVAALEPEGSLYRIPFEGLRRTPLFALRRPRLGLPGRVDALMDLVLARIERDPAIG